MSKKVAEKLSKEGLKEQLDKYIYQRAEVENMIEKYINLYQKLDGAIEALQALLEDENTSTKESGRPDLVGETES